MTTTTLYVLLRKFEKTDTILRRLLEPLARALITQYAAVFVVNRTEQFQSSVRSDALWLSVIRPRWANRWAAHYCHRVQRPQGVNDTEKWLFSGLINLPSWKLRGAANPSALISTF